VNKELKSSYKAMRSKQVDLQLTWGWQNLGRKLVCSQKRIKIFNKSLKQSHLKFTPMLKKILPGGQLRKTKNFGSEIVLRQ